MTWSTERRARHAAAIRRWAPWQSSTGPRTAAGKSRSARNAFKHGCRSAHWRLLRAVLANQSRLHGAAARLAHKNPANELLDVLVRDGAALLKLLLPPAVMQKPCILGPPEGKS